MNGQNIRPDRPTRRAIAGKPFRMLSALVAAFCFAAPASAQTLWELTPYRVGIYIAYSDDPALTPLWRRELEEVLAVRTSDWIGPSWDAHVEAAPPKLAIALRGGLETLSSDALTQADLEMDKVLCLRVGSSLGRLKFEARELDVRTRTWGHVVQREAGQSQMANTAAFETLLAAFSPLAKIEKVDDHQVRLRLRAASLKVRDPHVQRLAPGAIFQPIIRYNDREGKLRDDRLPQPIPWTFLVVRELGDSTATCELFTGLRSPLSARRRGRSEQLALAVRPRQEATELVVHSRVEQSRTLYGYEVFAYGPDSPKTTLLGQTDSRGALRVGPGEHPLRILVIKHGGEFLARLPIMPGLEAQLQAPVADDDYRLAVEGYITGMQERIVDLVAQRGTLMARIRGYIDEGRYDDAQTLLEALRKLPTSDELAVLLNEQRRKYFSSDALIRRKIAKLFDDTQQVMVRNLNPADIRQVTEELSQAVRANPGKSASGALPQATGGG